MEWEGIKIRGKGGYREERETNFATHGPRNLSQFHLQN